jgi:hypothetical protein
MALRLKEYCNKYAQKANIGEPELNALTLTYWMAAHFSTRIQEIKKDRPTACQEEILFYNLDRWGFPLVPWVGHAFKASLCKGPDHGIAMKLGLLPTDGKDFDPLVHLDLGLCTVTLDSWVTNKAMKNYATADWNTVRDLIYKVPLWHSYWRIDLELGNEIWKGAWDQSENAAPIPPSPAFSMPLVPIELWTSGSAGAQDAYIFKCEYCTESFDTTGPYVKHCRLQHDSEGLINLEEDKGLDDDVKEYWNTECKVCKKVLASIAALHTHTASGIHTDKPLWECKDCSKIFDSKGGRDSHLRHMHSREEKVLYPCDKCDKKYASKTTLQKHIKQQHMGLEKQHECGDCGKKFLTKTLLNQHSAVHSDVARFTCDICGMAFKWRADVQRHKKKEHQE